MQGPLHLPDPAPWVVRRLGDGDPQQTKSSRLLLLLKKRSLKRMTSPSDSVGFVKNGDGQSSVTYPPAGTVTGVATAVYWNGAHHCHPTADNSMSNAVVLKTSMYSCGLISEMMMSGMPPGGNSVPSSIGSSGAAQHGPPATSSPVKFD